MVMVMANDEKQTVNKDDETVLSTQEKPQGRYIPTGRPDLNEIKKRNAEEEKDDRTSTYILAGIMMLLIVVVIVLVYFFS